MNYYKQKQRDNEEMADYMFWLVVICALLAVAWAAWELMKFLDAALIL